MEFSKTELGAVSSFANINSSGGNTLPYVVTSLLSDYFSFYNNTVRGFHWWVKGRELHELQDKFEDLNTMVHRNIEWLAERVIAFGERPLYQYSNYLTQAYPAHVSKDYGGWVMEVTTGLSSLIISHQMANTIALRSGDLTSSDLLSRMVRELEKRLWMFGRYLSN